MSAHSKTVTTKKGNKRMTTHYIRGSTIWLNYYVEGVRKQKSTKLKDTPQNIQVVENKIIPALDIKIATGEIYKKKPKTFEYYGGIFLKQKSTNKSYLLRLGTYKTIIKHFGSRNIDAITRLDIKEYLLNLDIKSASKNIYKSTIKEIFEFAVDDAVLDSNPALNIKFQVEEKTRVESYTKDEVQKILNTATGLLRVYLLIAFNTGMRSGEILGLQLGDFENNYISIKRTRTLGVIGTGKNWNSNRKVPYPAFILEEVKKIQEKNIFIFANYDDAGKFRYEWDKAVKKAGVKRLRLYCARHTFATLMLQEKIVSINELAGILGHSSVKTTLDKYASAIDAQELELGPNFSLYCDKSVTTENSIASKHL